MGLVCQPLLSIQHDLHVRCCIVYWNKHTQPCTGTCLGKCQVWLTLRPWVMFKAIHLRLRGIAELIGTGTACPIGFPGLLNASHKASTKLLTMIYCTMQEKIKPGIRPLLTTTNFPAYLINHLHSSHLWTHIPSQMPFLNCIYLCVLTCGFCTTL